MLLQFTVRKAFTAENAKNARSQGQKNLGDPRVLGSKRVLLRAVG